MDNEEHDETPRVNEGEPPKKKRGPYKLYLMPGSNRPIPEATIRTRKKREYERRQQEQTGDENQGSTIDEDIAADQGNCDAIEPVSNVVQDEFDLQSTSEVDAGNVHLCTSTDPVKMAENDKEITKPAIDYVTKYDLSRRLHRDFPISALDVLLMILHLAIRHCHTQHFVEDLISFVNVLFGEVVLDISYHIFKNLFPSSQSILRHYFCPKCEVLLGSETESQGGKQKKCNQCDTLVDVSSVDSGNYFVTLSLREQIESLLARPDVKLIDHVSRSPGFISDIFDGELFNKCKQLGIAIENILTFTFNTDGVRVHESTKNTMWPILIYLNELIPEQRFQVDKVLVAGIWFGRSAPNMALFMKPFVDQTLDLAKNGITQILPNGVIKKFYVFPLTCSVDSVAKAKVVCQRQFNGYCGCLYCIHPNDSTVEGLPPQQRFYDSSVSYPPRTERQVITDMYEADKRDRAGTLKDDSVNGFRGLSVLLGFSELLETFSVNTFHIVWSVVIDYMHCILEGVCSDLLSIYLDILDPAKFEILNERIKKITPPQAMTRKPRPLAGKSEKCYWKAKEYRSFLLYYALPCLEDLLPARDFSLLKLFVNSVHILLGDNITTRAFSEAKSSLSSFVSGFQRLYGLSKVTYNLHLLTHLCDMCVRNGPLWCYSNFVFESCNGRLVKLIRGTRSIINEIAVKFTKLQNVPKIILENPISSEALEFCNSLLGLKYVKNGLEMDEAFITGSFSMVEVSDDECALLEASRVYVKDGQVKFYNRVIRKGIVYCSKLYSKTKVYNDSCVMLTDGQYVVIDKILLTSARELVCLVTPIRVAGSIIPPIVRCAYDCFADPVIVSFKDISRKCVLISFDDKNFICNVPNFYERD